MSTISPLKNVKRSISECVVDNSYLNEPTPKRARSMPIYNESSLHDLSKSYEDEDNIILQKRKHRRIIVSSDEEEDNDDDEIIKSPKRKTRKIILSDDEEENDSIHTSDDDEYLDDPEENKNEIGTEEDEDCESEDDKSEDDETENEDNGSDLDDFIVNCTCADTEPCDNCILISESKTEDDDESEEEDISTSEIDSDLDSCSETEDDLVDIINSSDDDDYNSKCGKLSESIYQPRRSTRISRQTNHYTDPDAASLLLQDVPETERETLFTDSE